MSLRATNCQKYSRETRNSSSSSSFPKTAQATTTTAFTAPLKSLLLFSESRPICPYRETGDATAVCCHCPFEKKAKFESSKYLSPSNGARGSCVCRLPFIEKTSPPQPAPFFQICPSICLSLIVKGRVSKQGPKRTVQLLLLLFVSFTSVVDVACNCVVARFLKESAAGNSLLY